MKNGQYPQLNYLHAVEIQIDFFFLFCTYLVPPRETLHSEGKKFHVLGYVCYVDLVPEAEPVVSILYGFRVLIVEGTNTYTSLKANRELDPK